MLLRAMVLEQETRSGLFEDVYDVYVVLFGAFLTCKLFGWSLVRLLGDSCGALL